ncbi:MAG: ABC transporter ATP-binding protein [Clostridiales bacterium]|nr:ABC transporter ATP-binding protein [Clostridiales bacterium]
MKKILTYFKPYKWQSLLGPLFKLLEATFELLVPFIVGLIVDKGLGERVNGGYPYADKPFIVWMCVVLALFGLFGLVFAVIAQYFAAKTATGVSAGVRKDLFRKIQSLSYKDIDQVGASTLLTRMTSDVDQMQSGINLFLRLFLRSPFIVFGAMAVACIISPDSFGVFAVTIVVLAIVVYAVMFACMPLYKKTQAKLDKVVLSARENLTGARVLRAFCQEEEEREIFQTRNEELTKGRKFVGGVATITNPLTYVLINFAIIWLLWVGALKVDVGDLSQGSVLALYNLMGQILIELIKLANLIVTVTKAAACAGRIETVLTRQPTILLKERENTLLENASGDMIVFDKVSARYNEGAENALTELSFTLKRGETLGVIGGTGSGKTTLVNLIPHFYDVTEGKIFVAGRDVCEADYQEELRLKVGIVPQKALLFKGTIRENLLWGKADATDEELMQAARLAQAEEVILDKGGLDATVEQGGKNFSGGQKQRLTIARALTRNPEILILDDSASALDYATDAALRKAIRGLNTTVVIVSQRASAVRDADKILVLDEGAAVGMGTHEQLMNSCEVYREIYFSQYDESKENNSAEGGAAV